jgi:serine/threonine protein phosphatase 1
VNVECNRRKLAHAHDQDSTFGVTIFNFMSGGENGPKGARGYRAYAIGDVHGRLDLLDQLLAQIQRDLIDRPARKVLLVFLGDLIDRGPSSGQVVERLRTYRADGVRTVFLLGNHEEVLLRILDGDTSLVPTWLQFGGMQCLQSYGVDLRQVRNAPAEEVVTIVRVAIPQSHNDFLNSFVDTCRFGDYLFVHAGVRPGVTIEEQLQADLRWIREPFLFDDTDHGCVVVHGHTIREKVEERPNRIGIDTGAYRTGVLTALAVEGSSHWYLQTEATVRT